MTKAVRIHNYGGPEALRYEDVTDDLPGAGQVRLRQTAIGLNYIDIYYRTGVYKAPSMPITLGCEAAGEIEAVGEGVTDLKVGDRVCYGGGFGGYAEARTMPADRLIKIPHGITDKQAAAMTLQGMTAQYLLRHTYRVQPGDTILVHAAAGGVGLIMCQWAKKLGATVIGTVGTEAKAKMAAAHGCDYPIIYTREDYAARVREITKGALLPVVYDSIGKDTFERSLDCLRPRGMMVSFGNASGKVDPVDIQILSQKGSLFLTRPTLASYNLTRAELLANARELFDVVLSDAVKIEIGQTYKLKDVAQAQIDLAARKTTGSTVILP
ncbi:MAG TPA: quinone oxidoreductase [Alphaproteobacteria bacterium]